MLTGRVAVAALVVPAHAPDVVGGAHVARRVGARRERKSRRLWEEGGVISTSRNKYGTLGLTYE